MLRQRNWPSDVLCLLSLIAVTPWMGGGPGGRGMVQGLTCEGQDACRCVFDDGSGTIDVSSLGNTDGTARFRDERGKDQFLYSYNPCYPFTEGDCSEAAVCQINNKTHKSLQIGDARSVKWLNGTQAYLRLQSVLSDAAVAAWRQDLSGHGASPNITVYYEHEEEGPESIIRESFVTYVCDPEAVTPRLEATGGDGTQVFFFRLTTQCACPNGCVRKTSGGNSLSAGSLLLIIFFVAAFVYLAGGMMINRVVHQSTGMDMVPQSAFWRALPGYVMDGCLFVTCQFMRAKETYTEVS